MDLTFQVLCNIALYSIRPCFYHQSHPQLGIVFALAQLLHPSESISLLFSIVYWAPNALGSSSFRVLSFCLFILFMEFSRQEYGSGLPLPFPVDRDLSELYSMSHPFWVVLHIMAHSFIELDKTVIHVISLVSFLCFRFSFCLPSDG